MKKALYILVCVVLVSAQNQANAQAHTTTQVQVAQSPEELGRWMMNYYKNPKPADVQKWLVDCQRQGLLTSSEGTSFGFLSQVMHDNPELAVGWVTLAESFPDADKSIVWNAAWYANISAAKKYFADKKIKDFSAKDPPGVATMPINSGSVLDFFWARYFASGDAQNIKRIVGALELHKDSGALEKYQQSKQTPEDKQAALNDAIFQAAMWSITSNCKQDDKIYTICKDLLASGTLSKEAAPFLDAALFAARPGETTQKSQDGSTSAK